MDELPVFVTHGTVGERVRGRKDGYSAGRPVRVKEARGLRVWRWEGREMMANGDERKSIGILHTRNELYSTLFDTHEEICTRDSWKHRSSVQAAYLHIRTLFELYVFGGISSFNHCSEGKK